MDCSGTPVESSLSQFDCCETCEDICSYVIINSSLYFGTTDCDSSVGTLYTSSIAFLETSTDGVCGNGTLMTASSDDESTLFTYYDDNDCDGTEILTQEVTDDICVSFEGDGYDELLGSNFTSASVSEHFDLEWVIYQSDTDMANKYEGLITLYQLMVTFLSVFYTATYW